MIFDLKDLEVDILKKFDGECNYFNPSHYNGKTIFRKQYKHNQIFVCDIVDEDDNIILKNHYTDEFLISYEDARFINKNEISVCVVKFKKKDFLQIPIVEFKKYNLKTNRFTNFKTQNAHFEKHWQILNDRILYHVDPYTILDRDENIIFKRTLNFKQWKELYGQPCLSTNVFKVNGKNYLLYHSYIWFGRLYYKYFIGLLHLDKNYIPTCYNINPLFESTREYSDNKLLNDLWSWRATELLEPVKYEVIFPMNIVVDKEIINVYSGLNDCSAVNIKVPINEFEQKIKNEPVILL